MWRILRESQSLGASSGERGFEAMRHVSVVKGAVVVRLAKRLYSRKALEAAAEEFSASCCSSSIRQRGNFFEVTLKPKSRGLCREETGMLFCNFALAGMQQP